MRAERLPKQKFQLARPAAGDKPYPSAEFYKPGSRASATKAIKRRSVRICALEWSWSPAHSSLDAYYLYGGRTYWMLWTRFYAEDFPSWDIPIVKCLRKGLGKREAAMMLLAACLDKGRREEELDRFHFISPLFKKGLLSAEEINAVADIVWDNVDDASKK
jgi:hypothetical protein